MFKSKRIAYLAIPLLLLAGCQSGEIESIPALTLAEVSGTRIANLTQQEQSSLVYDYISNSFVVGSDALIKITDKDMRNIQQTISGVDEVLKGKFLKRPNGTDYISDSFAQFLLLEMAKTPYTWQRGKVTAQGMDAKSRLYFVDVEYTTTDRYKTVVPDSKIPKGHKLEESLKSQRFQDYIAYMNAKESNNDNVYLLYTEFTNKWGEIPVILEEQQGRDLLQRARLLEAKEEIGAVTYSGIIEDPSMTNAATMTVRYILKYNYNLGEETNIMVDAVYIKDYSIQGKEKYIDSEEDEDVIVTQSLDLIKPFIKETLTSYSRALEQSNHGGLYTLYNNYAKYDKYFLDLNKTQYTNLGNFSFKILGRDGEQVKVLVEQETKQRAKNTYTSMPVYRDKHLFNLVLSNKDKVLVKNSYLLERTLIQEPSTIIGSLDKTNSDAIVYSSSKFTTDNEKKVVTVLKDFLQVVYNQDTNTTEFATLVDMGLSNATMSKIMQYTSNIGASDMKINYITKWNTRSNVYVSVDIREIFVLADSNLDTESTVELVNRNGTWYIVNYDRRHVIKTERGKIVEMKGVFTKNTNDGSIDLIFNSETGIIEELGESKEGNHLQNDSTIQDRVNKDASEK